MTIEHRSVCPINAVKGNIGRVQFMPGLTGLRGLAAMSVMMFHWTIFFPHHNGWLAQWHFEGYSLLNPTLPFALGWQGVYLFFVLSGFLLTLKWLDQPIDFLHYGQFLYRRFLRIFPGYWLQLIVLLLIADIFRGSFSKPAGEDLFNHLILWLNLPPDQTVPLNGVWWTLPVELMFYTVLPCMVWAGLRWSFSAVFLMTLAICLAWRWWVMNKFTGSDLSQHMVVLDAMPGVLAVFMSGFLMARACQFSQFIYSRFAAGLALIVLVLLEFVLAYQIETYWHGGLLLLLWPTLCALAVSVIVCRVAYKPMRWLIHPFMQWAGDRSYGIYLWHLPLMELINKYLLGQVPDWIVWVVLVFSTAILAEVSFRIIEKRAIQWGRKYA